MKDVSSKDNWGQHWNEYAESARLNPAQGYRRLLVFSLLDLDNSSLPIRLLDVGCGQGDFARDLTRRYSNIEILGLDLSQSGIDIAKSKVPDGVFIQHDLSVYQEPPEKFRNWATHAVCSEVLEHIDEPEKIVNNIKPYLAHGCKLIVTVPGGPMSQFDMYIGHKRHFNHKDLGSLLSRTGYNVKQVNRAGFPFFNLYRLTVLARGKKLINDVSSKNEKSLPISARFAMWVFSLFFKLNLRESPFGWQMVALAEQSQQDSTRSE